jgi:squalene synthase HpnC
VPWDFPAELRRHGPHAGGRRPTVAEARAYCARVTRSHAENFTVASWLLPRDLVPHFEAVYAYCRWADDLADETGGGVRSLALLDWWRFELLDAFGGHPWHPVTLALRETVRAFDLSPTPFLDLLAAFVQDQRLKCYDTFEQLRGYCALSADPVGRIVLHLFRCATPERMAHSDEICTGLQLANFWQDVARDAAIGRVYLPAEDRDRFGVTGADLTAGRCTPAYRELIAYQVARTRGFFERGEPLLATLPRTAARNVGLFLGGGRGVLRAIERQGFDTLSRRPRVSKWAKLALLARALAG